MHRSACRYPYQSGTTLAELIIALLIVGMLAGIAYPGYHEAMLKARRAEAKSALYAVLLQQERYYLQHGIYAEFSAATVHLPFKWWSADTPTNSHYEMAAQACSGKKLDECILITATPGTDRVSAHHDPLCGTLMLDSTHTHSCSAGTDPDSVCW